MQKVTLTKIFTKEEISPRTQKPYTRMSIKTQEHGDRWISGFQNKGNANWREGDTVEILLETTKKDDKEYLNFSLPKMEDVQEEKLSKIEFKMGAIGLRLAIIEEHLGIKNADDYKTIGQNKPVEKPADLDNIEYPDEELNLEDIPF